jgi:hypothetical protein
MVKVLLVVIGTHQFLRTADETLDDMPVYRLRGFGFAEIRHVCLLAKETQ